MTAPRARLRAAVAAGLTSAVLAAALAAAAVGLGWRGADLPNTLFRIELFRRAGFTVVSTAWYGGHHTPAYSVLLPVLGSVLGPGLLGASSAVGAAWCFDRLVRALPEVRAGPARAASLVFAAGTAVNLAVGRHAFALGLGLGLGALVARRRPAVAALLSVATPLASPVAGCFLALAWTAGALGRGRRAPLVLAVLAVAPMAAVGALFPEGGTFPFRGPALGWTLVACAAVGALAQARWRAVRGGVLLYALATLAVFVVPNPLGANVTRLGMFVAAPLVIAAWPSPPLRGLGPANRHIAPGRVTQTGRARRERLIVALLVAGLLWWQWSPALDAMVRGGRDPSTHATYYEPLVNLLRGRDRPVSRLEIPLTRRHFEATYVAPVVPLARGWERQLDMEHNPLFYEPAALTAASYRAWLLDNGIELVALADAPLDPSAEREARLIEAGLDYLRPVWRDAHWRVWEVVGGTGLVDGPAVVVRHGPETVELQAQEPGAVLVRVRPSALWSVSGPACVVPVPGEWVRLEVHGAGRVVLHPVVIGRRQLCR